MLTPKALFAQMATGLFYNKIIATYLMQDFRIWEFHSLEAMIFSSFAGKM